VALRFPLPPIDSNLIQVDVPPSGSTGVSINLEIGQDRGSPAERVSRKDREIQVLLRAIEPHRMVSDPTGIVVRVVNLNRENLSGNCARTPSRRSGAVRPIDNQSCKLQTQFSHATGQRDKAMLPDDDQFMLMLFDCFVRFDLIQRVFCNIGVLQNGLGSVTQQLTARRCSPRRAFRLSCGHYGET
jgi:hypothetical protein